MLGHGARPGGILPAESIPRDGLRDLRRELESPRLAKALSARLLARSSACSFVSVRRGADCRERSGHAESVGERVDLTKMGPPLSRTRTMDQLPRLSSHCRSSDEV